MKADFLPATDKGQYADVNGLRLYYELHGDGPPLVLIHGGGSTITTSFGKILPLLAEMHQVIALELQAHGHTSDRDAAESFEQDADDVAGLLSYLKIEKAALLGFSNGGSTALQVAIRHPEKVQSLVVASACYKRSGLHSWFWEGMNKADFSHMPQLYKDAFLAVNNSPAALLNMYTKDAGRMQTFVDWDESLISAIQAPVLVVVADHDVVTIDHSIELHRLLPNARLAILPGTHGSYMGEAMSPDPNSILPLYFAGMVNEFLAAAK